MASNPPEPTTPAPISRYQLYLGDIRVLDYPNQPLGLARLLLHNDGSETCQECVDGVLAELRHLEAKATASAWESFGKSIANERKPNA